MLFKVQISSRDSVRRVGGTVINSALISELSTSGTGASFLYAGNPESRRGGIERIFVSDTVARIRAIMNQTPSQTSITLAVYPGEDTSSDTVWTVFNQDSIIFAWPQSVANRRTGVATDANCYIDINERGSVKRYLVNHYYEEIAQLSRTVSTSTTTSHN